MNKRKHAGWIAGLLSISLLVSACAGNNEAPADNGEANGENGENQAVEISVFATVDPNVDLPTNSFTKLVEDKFNLSLDWTSVPYDGATEKRQISMSSGDYPDIFMTVPWVDRFTRTDMLRYGKQGVIIPLNDLIEEYAPNIQAALDNHPYYKAMNIAPDGNIYGLNQFNECYHCSYPYKMWLNTTWLDQLGLETPRTTEQFKAVLEAFKTQDPNGNGKADEVPLSGSTETFGVRIIPFLMNGFIYDDDKTFLMLKDGNVAFAPIQEEWKQGLAYIKSLYDGGLIDPGAFTQNAEAFKKIGENASAQILGAGAGMHPAIFIDTTAEGKYNQDYDAIAPLQGPNSDYSTFAYPVEAGASFVITNEASEEARVAAIKMLDYLFTEEGQLLSNYGEEDLNWRRPQEGEVALNEEVEPKFKSLTVDNGGEPLNNSWGPIAQYYQPKAFRDAWVQGTDIYDPSGFERRLQQATLLYDGKEPDALFPYWSVWVNPDTVDELSMIQTNITDYVDQNALQFITGDKSLEKDWDSYVKGLESLNVSRYVELNQLAYDDTALK
ncbi:extracellular solute-binding protein [Paenibacillus sp. IB182496]|uniref:Extracellular solute-binding protein n=1 Tax=Paenibacillus sabuli TaxID=2772509 RepID=A0A927BYV5_9BACL|nr:extracellular solute-binding protein [Paenibacillus sabuli]MBD2848125.1 extracellular solute-binding protein [Paenibacillus sabuli]